MIRLRIQCFKIRLIKNPEPMITLIKEPKLLDEKPRPNNYRESRAKSIKKKIIKTINI